MNKITLNLNATVTVELTLMGLRRLEHHFALTTPSDRIPGLVGDEYTTQLYCLFLIFGPDMFAGNDPVFERNCIEVTW